MILLARPSDVRRMPSPPAMLLPRARTILFPGHATNPYSSLWLCPARRDRAGRGFLLCTQRHHVALDVRPTAIFAPSFHQLPAPREHVAAGIGALRLVADSVRERDLDQLTRIVRALARPCPEGRAKTVNGYAAMAHAAKQLAERVRIGIAAGQAADEYKLTLARQRRQQLGCATA